MSFAEFFTEHDILINACLYLFIEMGIIEAQSQSVRPFFFSNHTDFSNHGFIMILVIKTFQMINLTFLSSGGKRTLPSSLISKSHVHTYLHNNHYPKSFEKH